MQFSPQVGDFRACYFDTKDLSLSTTGRFRYEVKEFLPNGVPIYGEQPCPQLPGQPNVRLSDGNFIFMMMSDDVISRSALVTPQGKEMWAYRNEGFSGFALPRLRHGRRRRSWPSLTSLAPANHRRETGGIFRDQRQCRSVERLQLRRPARRVDFPGNPQSAAKGVEHARAPAGIGS